MFVPAGRAVKLPVKVAGFAIQGNAIGSASVKRWGMAGLIGIFLFLKLMDDVTSEKHRTNQAADGCPDSLRLDAIVSLIAFALDVASVQVTVRTWPVEPAE